MNYAKEESGWQQDSEGGIRFFYKTLSRLYFARVHRALEKKLDFASFYSLNGLFLTGSNSYWLFLATIFSDIAFIKIAEVFYG